MSHWLLWRKEEHVKIYGFGIKTTCNASPFLLLRLSLPRSLGGNFNKSEILLGSMSLELNLATKEGKQLSYNFELKSTFAPPESHLVDIRRQRHVEAAQHLYRNTEEFQLSRAIVVDKIGVEGFWIQGQNRQSFFLSANLIPWQKKVFYDCGIMWRREGRRVFPLELWLWDVRESKQE